MAEIFNTQINANADFSGLISQVRAAVSELTVLQKQFGTAGGALSQNIKRANADFSDILRNSGQFTSQFVTISGNIDKFGRNLDAGRLKLKDYYRTWQDYHRNSASMVKELAKQQVALQNAILQPMGRNARGQMQFNLNIPTGIDELKNKTALAKKELSIMNKVMQDGSVQLINWGKNTQWAGRQLTVGLTVPIAAFGKAAADAFRVADQELTRLTKVYGGLAATSTQDLNRVRDEVSATARELAASYGVSFKDTIALAADIAATGKEGQELLKSLQETTRLSVLGEVDRQESMKATLAIQNAFKQNTDELAESINFLNAVENQTSTTLQDLVEAIPKAGPIIRGLGGSVEDLALYLTAMKEGGVDAASAANGLKSALGSLINPTKVAKGMFSDFGIDLESIVTKNAGNLTATILELQSSLEKLNPLQKQQALEQLFGKYQFARMGALFDNLGKQGSQTIKVLDLMKASTQEIGAIANRELTMITESASGRYRRALESLKADLAVVGEDFLNVATKIIQIADKTIQFFNKLPEPVKKFLTILGGFTAVAGPIIMLTGVFANFIGYVFKGLTGLRSFFSGAKTFQYITPEIIAAEKAASMFGNTLYSDAAAAKALESALLNLSASMAQLKGMSSGTILPPDITGGAGTARRVPRPRNPGGSGSIMPGANFGHIVPQAGMSAQEKAAQTFFYSVPFSGDINNAWSTRPQPMGMQGMPMVEGVTSIGGRSAAVNVEAYARYQSMLVVLSTKTKKQIQDAVSILNMTGRLPEEFLLEFQQVLPGIQRLASNAAAAATQISRQAQSGIITSQQAVMQIEAANRAMLMQLEAMAVNQFGIPASRLRMVPGTNQALYSRSPQGRATYNAKAFFRTGQGRMGDVVLPMSQQFGIPLTPEGYQYRNMGGSIFYNNGDQVPGPNVNADVVPAMLTPGEFVIKRDIAQQDPEGMRMLNDGQAMVVPVQKFQSGGTVLKLIKTYMSRYANQSEYRNSIKNALEKRQSRASSAAGRERDATNIGRFGSSVWLTRGPSTKTALDDYISSLPPGAARREAANIIEQYAGSIFATGRGVKKVEGRIYRRDANTIQLEDLLEDSILNKALRENGLPPMSLQTKIHATHLTQASLKNGKRLVSRYTADFDYLSNLQANQNSLLVSDFISRNLTSGRYGKYDRLLRAGGIPVSQRKLVEDEIDKALFNFLNDKRSLNIGDFGGKIKFKDLIPFIDDVIVASGGNQAQLNALKKNTVLRANKGGMIPGYIKGGWFPKPSGGGKRGWIDYLSEILSMRRKGTIGPYLKPRRLTNDDPAHGPIQIGRYRPEIRSRLDYYPPRIEYGVTGEDVYYRGMDPYQDQIATAWPVGSTPEARAQYMADQYARGGYEIMNVPNAQAMFSAAAAKRSGKFFRGISIPVVSTSTDGTTTIMPRFGPGGNKMLPLPEWLIKELDIAKKSGDFSNLIGKTFIMRRSSWSSNPQTAKGFGDFFIESDVNNRRMIPVSQMVPNLKFATQQGEMVSVNENEFMFGGKFIIKSAGPGGMKVASIPEIQNLPQDPGRTRIYDPLERRERGGNVIANTPYLVGEKGPELFVPRMNGGIIPNNKMMGYHQGGPVHEHLPNGLISVAGKNPNVPYLYTASTFGKNFGPENNMRGAMSTKGQGAMMLGSIVGGMAGYGVGERVGGPMGGMIGSTAGSMLPYLIPKIFSGKNVAMIARTNLAIAAVAGALYGLYKAYKSHQKTIEVQSLEFGLSEKAAKAAGLTYIDTAKKLSEARQNIKTSRESLQLLYINIAQAEPGKALNLTIKQLQDLKESVKKTMPDYIELINRTKDTSSLKALAINLKAQFMAAGKSAQEATQLVYALIAASDKAKFASKAIGTDGFMSVRTLQDATKVAQKAFESAQKQYEGAVAPWTKSARMKGVMDSFNTFLQAANAAYEEIVKNTKLTENGTKRAVTAAEALSIQLEKMKQSGLGNVQVSQGFLNNLRNTDPILAAMVKKGDSLLTIYAKQRLILAGVTADIRNLSEVEAERLSAYIGAISSGISETLDDTEGPLGKTNKRMSELDKIVKAAQKASSGFSVKQQINEREAIKLIDNKIKKINAEIDARKKALDLQKASTSYEAELAQLRLEYENAVASGNTEAAAAAKIRLSQLQQERQYALAEQALEAERERRLKPLEKAKENIQTRSQTKSDQAALAGEAGISAQGTLTKLEKAKQDFETAYNQYRVDVSMGYYEGKAQEKRAAETALLDLFKKAGGDKSFYQVKTGKTDFDQIQTFIDRLNKATQTNINSDMAGVARKFGMSVDKFDKVIEKLLDKVGKELPTVKVYSGMTGWGTTGDLVDINSDTKNLKPGDEVQDQNGKRWKIKRKANNNRQWEVTAAAAGGYITGPGTGTSDSIPAMLSNGEYVIRASSVKKHGKEFFDKINNGRMPKDSMIIGGGRADSLWRLGSEGSMRRFEGPIGGGSRRGFEGPIGGGRITNGSISDFINMGQVPTFAEGGMANEKPWYRNKGKGFSKIPLFKKENWEKTANFFGLPQIGRTLKDIKAHGGPNLIGLGFMQYDQLTGNKRSQSSYGDNLMTGLNFVPFGGGKVASKLGKFVPNFIKKPILEIGQMLKPVNPIPDNMSLLPNYSGKKPKIVDPFMKANPPAKGSQTIMDEIYRRAYLNAASEKRQFLSLSQNDGHSPLSSFLTGSKDDFSAAYGSIFRDVYNSLVKNSNPIVKDLSLDEFLTRVSSSGPSSVMHVGRQERKGLGQDFADDFTKEVNKTLVHDVLGLPNKQKIRFYRSEKYGTKDALNPKSPGYYSLSKDMAMSYFGSESGSLVKDPRILNLHSTKNYGSRREGFHSAKSPSARNTQGLYVIDLSPEEIPSIIGVGGMQDELAINIGEALAQKSKKIMTIEEALKNVPGHNRNWSLENYPATKFKDSLPSGQKWLTDIVQWVGDSPLQDSPNWPGFHFGQKRINPKWGPKLNMGGYINQSNVSKMSVPAYHLGGKVMAPYGKEILALLQGGEKVISKEQVAASSGGGAMTNAVFNFNFDGKIHPEDRQMLMIEAVRTFETKANLQNIKTGQVRVVG